MIGRLQNKNAPATDVNAVAGGADDTGAVNMPFNRGLPRSPGVHGTGVEPSPGMWPHNAWG